MHATSNRRKKAFGVSNRFIDMHGEQTIQSNIPLNHELHDNLDSPDQMQTHLPSYADLNSLEQFNFPPGYVDLSKITISNNCKVSFRIPITVVSGRSNFPNELKSANKETVFITK